MMLPGRILVWCHVAWQVLILPVEHFMKEAEVPRPCTVSKAQRQKTEGSWDENSVGQWDPWRGDRSNWARDLACDVEWV